MNIILDELKIRFDIHLQLLYCDNKSVMCIAHNTIKYDRIKHININKYFIIDNLNKVVVVTTYLPIGLQIAYIFTKGLH